MKSNPLGEHLVEQLGDAAKMPAALEVSNMGQKAKRVNRELARMTGNLPDPPPRPRQIITAEEVEEARRVEMERRKKVGELAMAAEARRRTPGDGE